jgi:hypothetical protein
LATEGVGSVVAGLRDDATRSVKDLKEMRFIRGIVDAEKLST